MAGQETFGASFQIDVTNLKAGLAQANKLIRENESEFKAAASSLEDWTKSEDGLNAKIKQLNSTTEIQKKKIAALQNEYDRLISEGMDPASKEAVELRTKINQETTALNKNEVELQKQKTALSNFVRENQKGVSALDKLKTTIEDQKKSLATLKNEYANAVLTQGKHSKAAKDLDKQIEALNKELEKNEKTLNDVSSASKNTEKSYSGLKKAGAMAAKGIAAIAAAGVAAIGSLLGLAESTRETRTNMAKLETAFTTTGLSAKDAKNAYKELYGILGDEGAATEAAAHMAQLANSQEDLSKWTTIAAGVYSTFGDSLPIEGLIEAANETAKTGKITGNLADALNWVGVSEDEFQSKLDKCSTEQERQVLITDVLNGKYAEAAKLYEKLNGNVRDAQEAQAGLTQALADLGAIAEPIMTNIKILATDLLETITPFVKLIGKGLTDALDGIAGAGDKMAEGISGLLDTLTNTIVQMLPTVIETVSSLIPKIITALLEKLPEILQTIVNFVPQIISTLATVLPTIVAKIVEIVPMLINSLIAAIPQLLRASIKFLMAIVQAIPTIITNLIDELPLIVKTIISTIIESVPLLIEASIQLFMAIIEAIPTIIESLIENLPLIIDAIIDGLIQSAPLLLNASIQLFMEIINAIPKIITLLIQQVPRIVRTIATTLTSRISDIISAAGRLFGGIIQAIPGVIAQIPAKVHQIISTIANGIRNGFSAVYNAGANLVRGIWEGISGSLDWIKNKIRGWVGNVTAFIKRLFGIRSPSRVMRDEVGKYLALGIGEGFMDEMPAVKNQINRALQVDDIGVNVNRANNALSDSNSNNSKSVVINQYITHSTPTSRVALWKNKIDTQNALKIALTTA